MSFNICGTCSTHYLKTDQSCPHCGQTTLKNRRFGSVSVATALLFGFSLTACGNKDETGSSEPATEPDPEPAAEPEYGVSDTGDTGWVGDTGFGPEYGVPMVDEDNDGYEEGYDCNDNDASTFPGAAELESTTDCMTDADGDGYGANTTTGTSIAGTDCDDSNAAIHPAATEVAGDGVDSNCNTADDN